MPSALPCFERTANAFHFAPVQSASISFHAPTLAHRFSLPAVGNRDQARLRSLQLHYSSPVGLAGVATRRARNFLAIEMYVRTKRAGTSMELVRHCDKYGLTRPGFKRTLLIILWRNVMQSIEELPQAENRRPVSRLKRYWVNFE